MQTYLDCSTAVRSIRRLLSDEPTALDLLFKVLEPREWLTPHDGDVAHHYAVFQKKSVGRHKESRLPMTLTPWEWARTMLKADADTRLAVVPISLPSQLHLSNDDPHDAMYAKFALRDGGLHLSVVYRELDAADLERDLSWFAGLLAKMTLDLQSHYPGTAVGSLTVYAHEVHSYRSVEPQ